MIDAGRLGGSITTAKTVGKEKEKAETRRRYVKVRSARENLC